MEKRKKMEIEVIFIVSSNNDQQYKIMDAHLDTSLKGELISVNQKGRKLYQGIRRIDEYLI